MWRMTGWLEKVRNFGFLRCPLSSFLVPECQNCDPMFRYVSSGTAILIAEVAGFVADRRETVRDAVIARDGHGTLALGEHAGK